MYFWSKSWKIWAKINIYCKKSCFGAIIYRSKPIHFDSLQIESIINSCYTARHPAIWIATRYFYLWTIYTPYFNWILSTESINAMIYWMRKLTPIHACSYLCINVCLVQLSALNFISWLLERACRSLQHTINRSWFFLFLSDISLTLVLNNTEKAILETSHQLFLDMKSQGT